MTKIIIAGAKGRMGQALIAGAKNFPDLKVIASVGRNDDLAGVIGQSDALIDFSSHSATAGIVELCVKNKKAIVIGTTGHSEADKQVIAKAQSSIPIVWASNFSTGVNTLFWLTRKAAEILGANFDLEIVEMHHRLKKDAPSGTAKTLAEILAEVRKLQLDKAARHGTNIGRNRNSFHPRRRCCGRPHRNLCQRGRTARTHAQSLQPRDFCQRRLARRALGRQTKARPL
jgi:4-hydroxy-tetrahydrodipicolinate reductase